MRMKTFTAKTMPEAMALVKKSMGADAVIMMTRQDAATGMMTVTAAVDEDFLPSETATTPSFTLHEKIDSPSVTSAIDEDPVDVIGDALDWHSIPRKLSSRILRICEMEGRESTREMLTSALEECLTFSSCPLQTGEAVALVGLPGAGKTVTTAKLATRAHLAKTPLHVITTDHSKAGGVEQLETLLRVLGLATHSAHDAMSLKTLLDLTRNQGAVLIDTPGINPHDEGERQELTTLLQQQTPIKAVLVIAAGMDASEATDQALAFHRFLPLSGVIVPKLDLSKRLGAAVAVAGQLKLPLLEAGVGSAIAGGLTAFSPAMLAERLLQRHNMQSFSKHSPLHSSAL